MRGDVFPSSLKLKFLACLLAVTGAVFVSQISAKPPSNNPVLNSSLPLKNDQLSHLAHQISVQILADNKLGSGVIIAKKGQIYTIITNAHVLRAVKAPYRVKTFDDHIYQATVIHKIKFPKQDLVLLQFYSPNLPYQVAKLGNSSTMKIGEEVWGVGFPVSSKSPRKFTVRKGRISLILDKPLADGYQIGYTSEIEKGMSGGAVLNQRGEVIAINGLSDQPLWDAPDYYADGTEPSPPLQKLIKRYSFGIPIEKVIQKTQDVIQS